jgi:secreted PhoX family phosphatase
MQLAGPAAGNKRLKTQNSNDGIKTLGTFGNCSGGITPWGTVLSGEENIDYAFSGDYSKSNEKQTHDRFDMQVKAEKSWSKYYSRFDMSKEPNQPLHMGWVVEVDPFDKNSTPKKRTALGRFKHEGCDIFINKDKHIIAYCGDDERFEYLYKFVSKNTYDPTNRKANLNLLDEGTLYCAKFYDDGRLVWLPLVYGQGPLTQENGFKNQGDVMIDTRKAADLLGATPMDRPEDVKTNPINAHVYVMLTNNNKRKKDQTDAVNPRAYNEAGQIVELLAPNDDHTSTEFTWDMFLIAGKKNDRSTNYHPDTSENGWLACPDNCTFDALGNLWIATDGADEFGVADGIWTSEVDGDNRQLTKRFLRTPIGAELCGPCFTEDSKNLFCSVQHPGGKSTFESPTTRWPDFDKKTPPRPAVVVITKKDNGRVGS